ncbi:MAG: GNAT family N-acetyltransferase [Pseudolysinimonas sp.]|uniref:GNAT family N-acetyltransferase n=1 Tax=Pseudolysinimonas sp. TaxID=2680009 RepID=UPI003266C4AF
MTVEIREVTWDNPDSARLRAAQQAEISARYGGDSEPGPKPSAADITVFFVAYDGETPVGCGGLRALDSRHGELKRMYVVPDHRGTGVSTAILRHLEADARTRGWERLVLETGEEQPDAVRFYEREGYTSIPLFGYYVGSPQSLCYEKRL